ncbi:hypothetical protein LCGC14_1768130, partial [marine sediment metagenome]
NSVRQPDMHSGEDGSGKKTSATFILMYRKEYLLDELS